MNKALILLVTLGLTACSSPDMRYYTLQDVAPVRVDTPATPADFQFEVLNVRVPTQVDIPQLVVRRSQTGLIVLENDRWSAPLADEFQAAIADRLERRLGTGNLAGLPKDKQRPILSVQIDVQRFDSLPGQYVLLDAMWSLRLRGGGDQPARTLTCNNKLSQPAGLALNNLVLAHQKVLDQLAEVIAKKAIDWAAKNTLSESAQKCS
ncbi:MULTISPECIES: PqiC family protein [Pseudomonas]|uniref:Membrane integrity-associated transporter subunit PqiC n=2 Tax=Pseudomonas TaxID=286 RepID=A0ABY3PXM9_9PSED|nr:MULTISPECIES: PqiC family protein [Pseudomonas]QYY80498.1 membrane integrity-associated transporter subunit PqiC [Pseudomonas germanica]UFP98706.1 membrane integrity-associated transporter subunit PqiC [Pseudomonas fitomaticsae]